jgi:hypothetical protein
MIQTPVEPLDYHGIVVAIAKDKAIDLEEVKSLLANPKEFAVLIEDASVAKAKT